MKGSPAWGEPPSGPAVFSSGAGGQQAPNADSQPSSHRPAASGVLGTGFSGSSAGLGEPSCDTRFLKAFSLAQIPAPVRVALRLACGSDGSCPEALARGRCRRGPGPVRPARRGHAPKRVESRRRWTGSAPEPAPPESGVRVTQEALTDREKTSCSPRVICCCFQRVLSV